MLWETATAAAALSPLGTSCTQSVSTRKGTRRSHLQIRQTSCIVSCFISMCLRISAVKSNFTFKKKSIRLIRKWADPMRSVGVVVGAKRPDQILFWLWHRRRLSYQRNYPNLCRLVGVSHSVVVNIVAVALATCRHCSILQSKLRSWKKRRKSETCFSST